MRALALDAAALVVQVLSPPCEVMRLVQVKSPSYEVVRLKPALVVQRHWRGVLGRRRIKLIEAQKLTDACVIVQKAWRKRYYPSFVTPCFRGLSSYTSILGDIRLWEGVP